MLKDRDVEIVKTSNSELKTTSQSTALDHRNQANQSVLFQQSKIWSRAIGWGIMGLIVAVITWASIAHIEEAIPADGKLEPIDDAKKIQAPMSGVVKQIYVKNGDKVQAGALLLRLESTVPESQLTYLASTKQSLSAENRFYREQMDLKGGKGKGERVKRLTPVGFPDAKSETRQGVKIAPEILALTQSRTALVAENQLYRAEMSGTGSASLAPEQQRRLESNVNELNTRLSAGKSEIGQVQKQLSENRVRRQGLVDRQAGIQANITSISSEIANTGNSLTTSLSQIDRQLSQNQAKISASQQTLTINQQMLADLRPAGAAGAVARSQIDRQQQEVVNRSSELEQQIQEQSRLKLEQQRLVSTSKADNQRQSEIAQLDEEHGRLELSASQSTSKLANSNAINRKDLWLFIT